MFKLGHVTKNVLWFSWDIMIKYFHAWDIIGYVMFVIVSMVVVMLVGLDED